MLSIVNYEYNNECISSIDKWQYGKNWPSVYIAYNENKAYIGETLDASRRTAEHLKEETFDEFSNICFISNSTFNKSVILDLESFLIKYMSSDEKALINGNIGISNHNYFYKEAYNEDFITIWNKLKELKIVRKSIDEIENSELFKYSPYKCLSNDQMESVFKVLENICDANKPSSKKLIQVVGGAGTGKTILAVFLIKLITDINSNKEWKYAEDAESYTYFKSIANKLKSIQKIGFVVPMSELNQTMKSVFKSIDGLDSSMVLTPSEVTEQNYDLVFVDEAHRLYRRKNLPNDGTAKFDEINKRLMGERFTTESDEAYTQLDWVINSSTIQVLFYDQYQSIRQSDIGHERFEKICMPHKCAQIELKSQMRCKGGNGYYEYIKKLLDEKFDISNDLRLIRNYEVRVVDSIHELFSLIKEKDKQCGLSLVMTGPSFSSNNSIVYDGIEYTWDAGMKGRKLERKQKENKLWSIHKVQGFDLNYGGVIFGKEIYYDTEEKCVKVNREFVKDNNAKPINDDDAMTRYVLNIYLTLMTRAIFGTYVYAYDNNLREYLRKYLIMES